MFLTRYLSVARDNYRQHKMGFHHQAPKRGGGTSALLCNLSNVAAPREVSLHQAMRESGVGDRSLRHGGEKRAARFIRGHDGPELPPRESSASCGCAVPKLQGTKP